MVVPAKNNTLSLPLIPSFGGWRLQPLGRQPLRLTHLPKHTLTIDGLLVDALHFHPKDVPPTFMSPMTSLSPLCVLVCVDDSPLQCFNTLGAHGLVIKDIGWRMTLTNHPFEALDALVSAKEV